MDAGTPRRPRRVPVVLVAGHLGAGKTTLVNHLLRHADGRRIGVVVNDFGAVAIDALLVAGQADAVASLADGCLCCEVDANGLTDLLVTLTGPRAGLDLVVVEASGLAEPRELVRMLLGAGDRAPHLVYGGLVVVVDAVEYATSRRERPELDDDVRLADLVVLNKVDRAGAGLVATLRDLAAGAVLPVTHGAVDPAVLADPAPRRRTSSQLSFDALLTDGHEHAHAHYDTVTWQADGPLDPSRLVAALEAPLPGVYRAKGFVRFAGDDRRFEVQTVGTALRVRPAPDRGPTSLVLIGAGIDADALRAALDACRADPDAPPGEHAMLAVLRHVDAVEPAAAVDAVDDP